MPERIFGVCALYEWKFKTDRAGEPGADRKIYRKTAPVFAGTWSGHCHAGGRYPVSEWRSFRMIGSRPYYCFEEGKRREMIP